MPPTKNTVIYFLNQAQQSAYQSVKVSMLYGWFEDGAEWKIELPFLNVFNSINTLASRSGHQTCTRDPSLRCDARRADNFYGIHKKMIVMLKPIYINTISDQKSSCFVPSPLRTLTVQVEGRNNTKNIARVIDANLPVVESGLQRKAGSGSTVCYGG